MDKFLYYPVKPYQVGQRFAESEACVVAVSDVPVTQRKVVGKKNGVCPPGWVELYPLLGLAKGHPGMDLAAWHGQKVYAAQDSIVEEINTEIERGLGIGLVSELKYDMGTHGRHYAKTRYWHLKQIDVKKGQHVKAGDVIGLADNTGVSAGDHLHFELKPVEYTDSGVISNVEQLNGFNGAIDPEPFFKGESAEDIPGLTAKTSLLLSLLKKMVAILEERQKLKANA